MRVHAVSLNYRELMILLQGRYPLPVKPDVVRHVRRRRRGRGARRRREPRQGRATAVIASIFPRWIDGPFGPERAAQLGGSLDGMLTEYAVLHEDALVPIPDHLSYEEAATLPCAAVTAWNALTGGGLPLQAGDDVLTLGSGGVSLFALQFAKAFGARVIATTSSDSKAARLRELGADEVDRTTAHARLVSRGAAPHRRHSACSTWWRSAAASTLRAVAEGRGHRRRGRLRGHARPAGAR